MKPPLKAKYLLVPFDEIEIFKTSSIMLKGCRDTLPVVEMSEEELGRFKLLGNPKDLREPLQAKANLSGAEACPSKVDEVVQTWQELDKKRP